MLKPPAQDPGGYVMFKSFVPGQAGAIHSGLPEALATVGGPGMGRGAEGVWSEAVVF